MSHPVNWPVLYCRACRVLAKKIVVFPVCRRSDGSGHEAAAAIGTDIAQHLFNAGGTERTFIGADARFKGVGRQRFIAMFAGRSEFQHDHAFYVT